MYDAPAAALGDDPTGKEVADFLLVELKKIALAFRTPQPNMIILTQYNVAPAKPRDGMVVYADGTNWNPGAGAGVYVYRGAAWHLLG